MKRLNYFSDNFHFYIRDYQCSRSGCKFFFWIAASVADTAVVNPNGIKTNGVSTFFIKGKPVKINGLRKLKNPSSWLTIFIEVSFNKTTLYSKDLITFIR